MGLPKFPVEGGCQCGAVRYRLKASPLSVYNCHCKDCQRYSGAAWSMSMPVRASDFDPSGVTVTYDRVAESGRVIVMHFCGHCHTWLWNEPRSAPGLLVVRAGSLDTMDWAAPVGNIWTNSKAAWVVIDPALANFPDQAPDRQPLYDAWTKFTDKDH
jgi:hypothetical protein